MIAIARHLAAEGVSGKLRAAGNAIALSANVPRRLCRMSAGTKKEK